jgi:hypothetical protein
MSVKGFRIGNQIHKYTYPALEDLPEIYDTLAAFATDTASGAIAAFPDGAGNIPVKDLSVAIEPVQDLHGYENPWPAGGGVNKWDEETEQGSLDTNTGVEIQISNQIRAKNYMPVVGGNTYAIVTTNSPNGIWVLFYDADKTVIADGLPIGSQIANNARRFANETTVTIPNNCAFIRFYFQTGYGTTYKYDTAINYPSFVTTYLPYSNICPISGWTGAKVTRTGKNLLDLSSLVNGSFIEEGPIYEANVTTHDYVSMLAGEYIWSQTAAVAGRYLRFYDDDKNQIGSYTIYSAGAKTFTAPEGTCYCRVMWYNISHITPDDIRALKPQIELGSTATDYEPYQGDTYSISFHSEAGTVYGGTLDVTTGKLTVDMKMVDLGVLNWRYESGWNAFASTLSDAKRVNIPADANWASSAFYLKGGHYAGDTAPDLSVDVNSTAHGEGTITIRDSSYTTAADFKIAMSGVQLCYELATPIVYDLTPTEVTTLLGANNIWADCGDSSVEYRADTKLYVDKKIAALANAN